MTTSRTISELSAELANKSAEVRELFGDNAYATIEDAAQTEMRLRQINPELGLEIGRLMGELVNRVEDGLD